MKKLSIIMALSISTAVFAVEQDPRVQEDINAFKAHFEKTFPGKTGEEFANGPYSFSEDKLLQYEAQMDMPAFEDYLDKGELMWNTPFKNGKTYASCFSMSTEDIRPSFPRWNDASKKVETLEAMLNDCRTSNGEKKIGWKKGKMAFISAFLNTSAAGKKIKVIVPKGNDDAYNAWAEGKNVFYTKRGQLNLSCADCHVYSAGKWIRGNILSPAYGQITHFPVWRGKWAKKSNGYGTIQRRYGGCYKQVRAQPRKAQKSDYTNLEYFHTSMSNGLEWSGSQYRE